MAFTSNQSTTASKSPLRGSINDVPARKRKPQMDMTSPYGRTAPEQPVNTSQVSAQSPYSSSQVYRSTQPRPSYTGYGTSSGDRSRQAFGQAAALQQRNSSQSSLDQFAQQYRQQQEQTRAADIQSQRQDQLRRYGMDEDYLAKRRAQEIRRFERIKDIRNQVNEARRSSQANLGENAFGLVLSGLMPAVGARVMDRMSESRAAGGVQPLQQSASPSFFQNLRMSLVGK